PIYCHSRRSSGKGSILPHLHGVRIGSPFRRQHRRISQKANLSGSQLQSAKGKSDGGCIERSQPEISLPNARKSGLMPARDFVRKEIESLVFFNRPTERRSRLHPRVSRIGHIAEGIHRLKIAVAQISEDIAMKSV